MHPSKIRITKTNKLITLLIKRDLLEPILPSILCTIITKESKLFIKLMNISHSADLKFFLVSHNVTMNE